MSEKRYGRPRAKDGELKLQYGRLRGDNPDIVYSWGDGVDSRDSRLLHYIFTGKRERTVYGDERERNGGVTTVWDDSFIDELKARGYDITTIRFSIQKKKSA